MAYRPYFHKSIERWEIKYVKEWTPDGKVKKIGTASGRTPEAAIARRDAAEEKLRQQQRMEACSSDTCSFASVAIQWLKEVEASKKSSTAAKYRNNLWNHLIPAFGACQISEITRDQVIEFQNRLLKGEKDGKGCAVSTEKGILHTLKSILKFGASHYDVKVVDLSDLRPASSNEKKPIRVLSWREHEAMIGYILENNFDLIGMGIIFSLYTGIRIGELCALKWKHISLEEGVVRICGTMSRIQTPDHPDHKTEVVITEPKTSNSVREIPLHDDLIELLKQFQGGDEAFFLTGMEDVFVEPRTMQYHIKKIYKKLGIEDAHFHTLRHTFATICIETGMSPKVLMLLLGHASIKTTLELYVHPSIKEKSAAVNKIPGIDNYLES